MSRVLLNLSSPPAGVQGGIARFGIELSRRLVLRGRHDYTFRSQWSADQLPPELAKGAAIEVIPPIEKYLQDLVRTWARGPRTHPASKFDLLFNLDSLGFATGGRRRMTIVHDIYFCSVPEMFSRSARMKERLIHRIVLGRSHSIVGISEATSSEVRRHFPASAARVRTVLSDSMMNDVIPGALPPGLVRGGYVLAVAKVLPNKNFGLLAEAFARIAPDFPDLKLVHVGSDAGETFESALAPRGLSGRLGRLRGIDDPTLAALYRDALCLVVPSLYEGFCLPLLEAQRFGCPTVFSERSATGEVGGEGGIPFDPTDVDALEAILRRVAADPALRADMVARGHANARRFSWDATVDGYERAIDDVLEGR
ncbi:glycosyltransferase family 1 protein [Sphingomonas sp.]|uniref:glycosyltransferase family 4 protein n=1 Tax=Sphingomonas sp. TaxID=28214 RepID=UPI000DB76B17|nr:glycosyltransferase family 1 protein [Sphingomonas sp.]PZU07036.1 MAG: glycosyltransferase family 1 protein [Sphingomonas sp.]